MSKLLAPRRIGVCGSSKGLSKAAVAFCGAVGRKLASESSVQIITGGTKCRTLALPGDYAADWLVANAARNAITPTAVASRIVTIAKDEEDVGRFVMGAKEMARGRTSAARRIAFVQAVHALIAVAGRGGTEQELALAMEFRVPILPVPTFGGESREFWDAYRSEMISALGIDRTQADRWEAPITASGAEKLASEMIDVLLGRVGRRCFVIMPFDPEFNSIFEDLIVPAVRACGDDVVRIDKLPLLGDALAHVRDGIRHCDYVVAVLDRLKPNVMYELGLSHALGKPSILLKSAEDATPTAFDIYTHQRLAVARPFEILRDELVHRIRMLPKQ